MPAPRKYSSFFDVEGEKVKKSDGLASGVAKRIRSLYSSVVAPIKSRVPAPQNRNARAQLGKRGPKWGE